MPLWDNPHTHDIHIYTWVLQAIVPCRVGLELLYPNHKTPVQFVHSTPVSINSSALFCFKVILRDLTRDGKKMIIIVCIMKLWNDPSYFHISWSSVYSYWLLCIKLKYSEHSFPYTILQHELYRDPGKGNVIAVSVIITTPVVFIFTRYCLFLMFFRFISTIEKWLAKKYIEGALMRKSHNIGLSSWNSNII